MAWKLLRNKIGKSNKSELDFLKEDLLSDPYKKLDMEEMSSILEKGISQKEISDILEEQKKRRQSADRLKSKQ